MSYTLIERRELTSAASSISFDNIPQFYTDLYVLVSGRMVTGGNDSTKITFNANTSGYTSRWLTGSGSAASSGSEAGGVAGYANLVSSDNTANTFSNGSIYIPNYTGSTNKSYSGDAVGENNGTTAYQSIVAGLWSNTAPITSVKIESYFGSNLAIGSSVSLYGINRQQAIGRPKAVGGAITFANGYWYHTFTGSGTFYAQENLVVDTLVIGGGGGGGAYDGGGGGAGGFLSSVAISLTGKASYPIAIGAGGPGGVYYVRGNGQPTSFLNITASGGGGGGVADNSAGGAENGGSGASGGGARGGRLGGNSGGTGISGQGNNGGSSAGSSGYGSGGGGGAGGAGSNGTTSSNGSGGPGLIWLNGSYYAGGGGGASLGYGISTPGSGGVGGGGSAGNTAVNGTANTGGGGGADADSQPGGSGGSGIVIIRYSA